MNEFLEDLEKSDIHYTVITDKTSEGVRTKIIMSDEPEYGNRAKLIYIQGKLKDIEIE